MNIFENNPELGEQWFRYNSAMMLISGPNGEIYDANNEFLSFIGYSLYEFQRKENPVTWFDITIKDEDLDTDKYEASATVKGVKKSYNIRKHYIPKQALPKLVNLHVSRFPQRGGKEEFQFFLVEVYNLNDTTLQLYKELDKINEKTTQSLNVLHKTLEANNDILNKTTQCLDNLSHSQSIIIQSQDELAKNSKSTVMTSIIQWCSNNPQLFSIIITFFIILFTSLLFGERAIEIFSKIYNLFKGGT